MGLKRLVLFIEPLGLIGPLQLIRGRWKKASCPTKTLILSKSVQAAKLDVPQKSLILKQTPITYLSGVWLRVNLRTDTRYTCVEKRSDYVFKTYSPS